jgi:tellurite resistance protein
MKQQQSSDNGCTVVPTNRLQFFPIMMFAIVMGFSGLAIVYQKAAAWFGFPHFIGGALASIDTFLFFTIAGIYIVKIFKYNDEVKKEFKHPIRLNFFAATSISLLLLGIVYHEIDINIAKMFWYPGAILHLYFTFYTLSFWINHNFEIQHSNPAWFIPIVGNVLVPVGGAGFVDNHILMFYFATGIFFWIILLPIIVNRIIFHHQLAQKFIPTLFILIAPPAVGVIAYVKMTGEFDLVASFLYNIGLFFTLLLIFMYKSFMKLKFFISWWAFTFPLAAVTISSMLAYHKTGYGLYSFFSYLFLIITTIVVLIVAYRTLEHMKKREICIEE